MATNRTRTPDQVNGEGHPPPDLPLGAPMPVANTSQDLEKRLLARRENLKPPAGFFQARYPSLWHVLVPPKDAKGRKVDAAFIGFTADGTDWKVTLRVPLGGQQTSFTIQEPTEIWDALESVLNGETEATWRETKTVPKHLKKDS